MHGVMTELVISMRRVALTAVAATIVLAPAASAQARGPESISDVAEKVIDAVVNISTSQNVEGRGNAAIPQLPPGSPFEEFFDEFFKNRRGGQGGPGGPGGQQGDNNNAPNNAPNRDRTPRRVAWSPF